MLLSASIRHMLQISLKQLTLSGVPRWNSAQRGCGVQLKISEEGFVNVCFLKEHSITNKAACNGCVPGLLCRELAARHHATTDPQMILLVQLHTEGTRRLLTWATRSLSPCARAAPGPRQPVTCASATTRP